MKLTPTPHAHSMQSQFEAHCLARGAKLGVLAIASPEAYANPRIQAAWLRWQDNPFQSPEPFQSEEPFSSGEFQVSERLAQHSVVCDEEDEE